jgi:hypothetical protein
LLHTCLKKWKLSVCTLVVLSPQGVRLHARELHMKVRRVRAVAEAHAPWDVCAKRTREAAHSCVHRSAAVCNLTLQCLCLKTGLINPKS